MADRGALNTATFLDSYLKFQHSPAADMHVGQAMVTAGSEHSVDPLILLSIAGHETVFGKEGAGLDGLLGLAFDDGSDDDDSEDEDPDETPHRRGAVEQVSEGARLFNELRKEGHSFPTDSIEHQLLAVNRAGWSTDANWHNEVFAVYRQVAQAAHQA